MAGSSCKMLKLILFVAYSLLFRVKLHVECVNGTWSEWSVWSPFSKTCGLAQRTRTRNCRHPLPLFSGVVCVGNSNEIKISNLIRCYSGPDDCEFELFDNPTCHWKNTNSTLKWRRHHGPGTLYDTGPTIGDASGGLNGDGHYMYFEAPSSPKPGDLAVMTSKSFPPTSNRTITFKYYMRGESITYLEVNKVDDVNGTKTQLFRKNGEQGAKWLPSLNRGVSINFASAVDYRIQFETKPGVSNLSDIAVDDIFFTSPAITSCIPNPCQHKGNCTVTGVSSFNCTCSSSWTGSTCTVFDYCVLDNPCGIGGVCMSVPATNDFPAGRVTCICRAGWIGEYCTTMIDNCAPNPCHNKGACTNGLNSFTCACAAGWTGPTCRFRFASVAGYGTFKASLSMYNDNTYTTLHSSFPAVVHLDQRLHFQVQVGTNDADVVVLIETCSASPTADENHALRYYLIRNRCATDSTIQFHNVATASKIRFSFASFKFFKHSQVYLHCQVFICIKGSSDSRCSSGCTGNNINRFRRSTLLESEDETQLWPLEKRDVEDKEAKSFKPLKTYNVGIGPFVESKQGSKRSFNGNTLANAMVIVVVALAILLGYFITKDIVKMVGTRKRNDFEKREGSVNQESRIKNQEDALKARY